MTKDPHLFCRRRCGITSRHVVQSTFCLSSLAHYWWPCYIVFDCTFCHTLALCALAIIQNQWCPLIFSQCEIIGIHPCTWMIAHTILNAVMHRLFFAVAPFALYCMRQSMCITPQFSLHTLLSERRLLSWYSIWKSTIRPAIMLCSSSAAMWYKIKEGRVRPILLHLSDTGTTRQFKRTI